MRRPILHSLAPIFLTIVCRAENTTPEVNAKVEILSGVVQGFTHPGIGFTKGVLENARTQVIAKRDPWWSAYQKLAACRTPSANLNRSRLCRRMEAWTIPD